MITYHHGYTFVYLPFQNLLRNCHKNAVLWNLLTSVQENTMRSTSNEADNNYNAIVKWKQCRYSYISNSELL